MKKIVENLPPKQRDVYNFLLSKVSNENVVTVSFKEIRENSEGSSPACITALINKGFISKIQSPLGLLKSTYTILIFPKEKGCVSSRQRTVKEIESEIVNLKKELSEAQSRECKNNATLRQSIALQHASVKYELGSDVSEFLSKREISMEEFYLFFDTKWSQIKKVILQ